MMAREKRAANVSSILDQARAEGYREGIQQAGQVNYDHAFEMGERSAREEAPSRVGWWLFGIFVGSALATGINIVGSVC